jgi:molybdopterin molybdotransferase
VQQSGAIPLRRPVLPDTFEAVKAGLRQSLSLRPDAIVTTGGISAGDLDFIREVAKDLGERVEVRRVAMKPGKPLVYGIFDRGVPFFGLPGNPAACLVSFEVFVRPALAIMEGREDGFPPRRLARVTEGQTLGGGDRLQYLRGRVEFVDGDYRLLPLEGQGSHQLSSFARANCLVEVPPERTSLEPGERVEVLLL